MGAILNFRWKRERMKETQSDLISFFEVTLPGRESNRCVEYKNYPYNAHIHQGNIPNDEY